MSERRIEVKYKTTALVSHKTYIKNGSYRFKDPFAPDQKVILEIGVPDGIDLSVGKSKSTLASKESLFLSTAYRLACNLFISAEHQLFPTEVNQFDWPRTSEGREYLENTFLERINYFFDNITSLSSKRNPNHHLIRSVRPIGKEDIISIDFSLNGKVVAAQGNTVLTQIATKMRDDRIWPMSSHITRSFSTISSEQKLLNRSCALIRIGFYQEALIVAFSVLDAKIQELIKERLEDEFSIGKNESKDYLMNISQSRLDTLLNFLFKILDKTSLKANERELSNKIRAINSKRNRIVHAGEEASKDEAKDAIITIAKTLNHLNEYHKGDFDVPVQLLDNSKKELLF